MKIKFLSQRTNHPLFKTKYYEVDESWCYINWYYGFVTKLFQSSGMGNWTDMLILLENQKINLRKIMGNIRGIRLLPGHMKFGNRKYWSSLSSNEKEFIKQIDPTFESIENKIKKLDEELSFIQKKLLENFEIKNPRFAELRADLYALRKFLKFYRMVKKQGK